MSLFADTGDEFVSTTSSVDQYLKSHAVVLPDGSVAVLLINERAGDGYNDANVTLAINGGPSKPPAKFTATDGTKWRRRQG